jgi:hypothetical protein
MQGEVLRAMRVYRNYQKHIKDELGLMVEESSRDYFDEIVKSSMS